MRWLMKLFGLRPKPETYDAKERDRLRELLVPHYRELGAALGCAPTAKTSDDRIMEIFERVTTAFCMAAKKRGERLPVSILDRIVFNFMCIYEEYPQDVANERLKYELARYLRDGFKRDDSETLRMAPSRN